MPNASNGWVKVHTLESISGGLAAAPPGPRLLCGDLNTPPRELPDGTVLSFARDSRGNLRTERGVRWDAVELGVVPGVRELEYSDAFRTLHGYSRREPSWTWRQRATWRDEGLSDHSAIEADLELVAGATRLAPPHRRA